MKAHLLAPAGSPAGDFRFTDPARPPALIRRLSLRQGMTLSAMGDWPGDPAAKLGRAAALLLVGPDNRPLFADDPDGHEAAAEFVPVEDVNRLVTEAMRANGLAPGGADAAKKPSPATPS